MWRYTKQVEGLRKYTLVLRDKDLLRLARVRRGCWKEIGASHRGFPGPEARIWEVSRIIQPASYPFFGCLDCHPCFSLPSHSFFSRYRLAPSADSSICMQPWWLLLNGGLCSESAGSFTLVSNSLLAQSLNILILKSQRRESDSYLKTLPILVQLPVNDGSASTRVWIGRIL